MNPTHATAVLIVEKLHLLRRSRSFVIAERISRLTGSSDRVLLEEIARLDKVLQDPEKLKQWSIEGGNARLREIVDDLAASKAYLLARSTSQVVNAVKMQLAEPTAYSELTLLLRRSLEPEPIAFWDNNLEMSLRANPFLVVEHQLVDVVIPVYGSWAFLNTAIIALARVAATPFRVILVDDKSPEPVPVWLESIPGVVVVRRESNGGFSEACNSGARLATAPALLLLNMDVQIEPDTIQHLLSRLDSAAEIGVVGGKLCYPNGVLQEAGGLVDAGGVVGNLGHGEDQWHPKFNYVRPVDYVSGALLMTKTALYHELDGLSSEFGSGYFEDTDFCMRARQLGHQVVYEPRARAMHSGGGSFTEERKAELMSRNASLFFNKWERDLKLSPRVRSCRRSVRPKVLIVDSTVPVPDRDSGTTDTYMFVMALLRLGLEVAIYPIESAELDGEHAQHLQGLGVEVLCTPFIDNPTNAVKCIEPVDCIFLFRYPAGGRHIDTFRRDAPNAKVIFLPVDLHYLRESRGSALGISALNDLDVEELRSRELGVAKGADEVWVLSDNEALELHRALPHQRIRVVPFFRSVPHERSELLGFDERRDIGFIGNFKHQPNVDAMTWFLDNVWDTVLQKEPDLKLVIAGSEISYAPAERWRQAKNVEVVGWVPSEYEFLETKLVSLAPLRFGAGIKGKVASSLLVGTPCVGTSIAFEGMGLGKNEVVAVDDPDEMAAAVVAIVRDRQRWTELSKNGFEQAMALWSYDAGFDRVKSILKDLKLLDPTVINGDVAG